MNDKGASTVEYALVIVMVVCIIGVGVQVMRSGSEGLFKEVIAKVLSLLGDFGTSGPSPEAESNRPEVIDSNNVNESKPTPPPIQSDGNATVSLNIDRDHQQNTGYTCGPCSLQNVLIHYCYCGHRRN